MIGGSLEMDQVEIGRSLEIDWIEIGCIMIDRWKWRTLAVCDRRTRTAANLTTRLRLGLGLPSKGVGRTRKTPYLAHRVREWLILKLT